MNAPAWQICHAGIEKPMNANRQRMVSLKSSTQKAAGQSKLSETSKLRASKGVGLEP